MKFTNYLKKAAGIGVLVIAEAVNGLYNSGGNVESEIKGDSNEKNYTSIDFAKGYISNDPLKTASINYFENFPNPTAFDKAKTNHEEYKKSELEKMLKKRLNPKQFYLTPDSLNAVIKQAYDNVKKWPKEFDKRLYRLLLKQESRYNVYAVSKTGYKGLGQIGPEVVETFRPEEFAKIKDPNTGYLDNLALEKQLFNPVTNLELTLENLEFISKFCSKYDPNWEQSDLDTKRKKILFCYNAGIGTAKDHDFNHKDERRIRGKKLKKENREYPEVIMDAYHNPNVKVKL